MELFNLNASTNNHNKDSLIDNARISKRSDEEQRKFSLKSSSDNFAKQLSDIVNPNAFQKWASTAFFTSSSVDVMNLVKVSNTDLDNAKNYLEENLYGKHIEQNEKSLKLEEPRVSISKKPDMVEESSYVDGKENFHAMDKLSEDEKKIFLQLKNLFNHFGIGKSDNAIDELSQQVNLSQKIKNILEQLNSTKNVDNAAFKNFLVKTLENISQFEARLHSQRGNEGLHSQRGNEGLKTAILNGLETALKSMDGNTAKLENPIITSSSIEKENPNNMFEKRMVNGLTRGDNKSFAEVISKSELDTNSRHIVKGNATTHKTIDGHQLFQSANNLAKKTPQVVSSSTNQNKTIEIAGREKGLTFAKTIAKENRVGEKSFLNRSLSGETSLANSRGEFTKNNVSVLDKSISSSQRSEQIMQRIVGQIRQNFQGGKEMFSLKLRPKELGSVDVWMSKDKDGVRLKLSVESGLVKEAIETKLQDMAKLLEMQNIDLKSFEISVKQELADNLANKDGKENMADSEFSEKSKKEKLNEISAHQPGYILSNANNLFFA